MSEKPTNKNFEELLPRDILACSTDLILTLESLGVAGEIRTGDYFIVISVNNYPIVRLTQHIKNIADKYPGVRIETDSDNNLIILPKYIH
jgi:hypothetical protein